MKEPPPQGTSLPHEPLWYKNAIIYQAHVRAFYDHDGNGIGDFKGLTAKLDYLQDLGITAVWLLPFYPSPLRDDGYDIADYQSINPIYGTLSDFKVFLREAHERGLRVITELVINHTSDQHPWFQRSRRAAPGSRWRDFYVWSDTAERYKETRIIFKDFEPSNWSWDPVAGAYYWHRFYSHQPDLNFDYPPVHREIIKALDFWLDMGVDGLRLDAVPYLYEREGTNCENLPETHDYLKRLRAHVDARYGDRMLLAEANQWPEDAVAYFGAGDGDECHMAFHFPLMPRLFMAIRQEDRVPIIDIMDQTPAIPATSQWATFLRNHDELTLEMVTDEERDYMYRSYAAETQARINLGIRRRLAPLLENDRKRIELLNALLFCFPGTPVIYYGDEIGMGDNIFLGDRNGVRTPMQWSSDRNAGFSRTNPQRLYLPVITDPGYHYESVNVEAQQGNPHSLLWWMKRLIALRRQHPAFGHGTLQFLQPDNRKVLAFIREHEGDRLLMVANLSRFVQPVQLDLAAYAGSVPVELFGRTEFPAIQGTPYFLTLGPHAFCFFSIQPGVGEVAAEAAGGTSFWTRFHAKAAARWQEILEESQRPALEAHLLRYIRERRWFGGKARKIKALSIEERIPVNWDGGDAVIVILEADYYEGDAEFYQLPLTVMAGDAAETLQRETPHLAIGQVRVEAQGDTLLLCDAVASPGFARALLDGITRRSGWRGAEGTAQGNSTQVLRRWRQESPEAWDPVCGSAEQSNSSIRFGQHCLLKLFRKLEQGLHPDLEVTRFLTRRRFPNVPTLAGHLEYRRRKSEPVALGVLNQLVPNARDAWEYTLESLERFYEAIHSLPPDKAEAVVPTVPLTALAEADMPATARELLGPFIEDMRMLGTRTAALHRTLASDPETPAFAPEAFTLMSQRSLFQSMRKLARQSLQLLRRRLGSVPADARPLAEIVANAEADILRRLDPLLRRRINAMRIRSHGDFHLGQVLQTGKDFIIIDFEGEPARPISERRLKRSPFRDVAGMVRSFQYAASAGLRRCLERGVYRTENVPRLESWSRLWYLWTSASFLGAYLEQSGNAAYLPSSTADRELLLNVELIDKAMYELAYELNNRPDWVHIPLEGIRQIIQGSQNGA